MVKDLPANANAGDVKDTVSITGSGRSPAEGNGNPLQHSFLENSMHRGAWWATVDGVAESQTRLSTLAFINLNDYTFVKLFCEKAI